MTYYTHLETPAGTLLFIGDGKTVTGMHWKVFKRAPKVQQGWVENKAAFKAVTKQLDQYFKGSRTAFDFAYQAEGTDFQKKVWKELSAIKYGKTLQYQDIANKIGKPTAVRAVGTAIGSNPVSIAIPCHRVLGSNHKLTGYAGGLPSKKVLLMTEHIDISHTV